MYPLKMAIFLSYFSLPEGRDWALQKWNLRTTAAIADSIAWTTSPWKLRFNWWQEWPINSEWIVHWFKMIQLKNAEGTNESRFSMIACSSLTYGKSNILCRYGIIWETPRFWISFMSRHAKSSQSSKCANHQNHKYVIKTTNIPSGNST